MKHGMTNDEIKDKLKEIILANTFYEGEVKDNHDMFSDLEFESLSFSALVLEIEEEFSISISRADIENGLNTPKKIYDLIIGRM